MCRAAVEHVRVCDLDVIDRNQYVIEAAAPGRRGMGRRVCLFDDDASLAENDAVLVFVGAQRVDEKIPLTLRVGYDDSYA
jgi:hypothetical protein